MESKAETLSSLGVSEKDMNGSIVKTARKKHPFRLISEETEELARFALETQYLLTTIEKGQKVAVDNIKEIKTALEEIIAMNRMKIPLSKYEIATETEKLNATALSTQDLLTTIEKGQKEALDALKKITTAIKEIRVIGLREIPRSIDETATETADRFGSLQKKSREPFARREAQLVKGAIGKEAAIGRLHPKTALRRTNKNF